MPKMIDAMMLTMNKIETVEKTPSRSRETDEEIIERLRERFNILDDMTRAVKKGDVSAILS